MNLASIETVNKLLSENGFSFKKSLGQNFLIDEEVCPKIAEAAADSETGVLEIGPGIGVLTKELSKRSKKTVAVEVDKRLEKILKITLKDSENTEIIFSDVMKLDLKKLLSEKFSDCKKITVAANLPYYITSPIITGLLEQKLPIEKIVVMVQKEAADRLCAKVGTRTAGAVTVFVDYYSEAKQLFFVPKEAFMPSPKVNSEVIELYVRKSPKIKVKDEKFFFKFVKACFSQRRKTLVNTVSNTMGIEKQKIIDALNSLNEDERVRSETLSMETLGKLSDMLCE